MLTEISGTKTTKYQDNMGPVLPCMLLYQKFVWLNTELVVFLDELTLDSRAVAMTCVIVRDTVRCYNARLLDNSAQLTTH